MTGHVLTWRQRRILQAISELTRRLGYPPSIYEIADAVGLASGSSVTYQLSVLQDKGYLHRDGGRSRAVRLVDRQCGCGESITWYDGRWLHIINPELRGTGDHEARPIEEISDD